jgi:hypothetical protein
MWVSRLGENRWRLVCMNDARTCTDDEIEAGHRRLLEAQRARYRAEREARGSMEPTDLFHGLPALDYIRELTGEDDQRGFFRCPFHGDGNERTPSLHATGVFWFCHGCQKGGTIYDFGALKWGIEPRGEGFKEIRERLRQALLGAAI